MKKVFLFFRNQKLLTFFLLFILVVIFFKGSIYRVCVSYEISDKTIIEYYCPGKEYDELIDSIRCENEDDIIRASLAYTSGVLSFTTEKCSTEPCALIRGGKTNCVGYANLCALLCDRKFGNRIAFSCPPKERITKTSFTASSHSARIRVFGYNIHQLFDSPFWKDHDIVIITNKITHERLLLDPTLYDYTGIGEVSERK